MAPTRILYDPVTRAIARLPEGPARVELGRESYAGIPVPVSPRRMKGDGTKIEALFRNFPEAEKKRALEQLRGLSRRHAVLEIRGGKVFLSDAGSRNGVLLKGVGIGGADRKLAEGEKVSLENGAHFLLGAWPLQYFDAPADLERIERKKTGVYVPEPPRRREGTA